MKDDAGYTLAEALVTMVITAVFMGVTTTSIISLYSSANRSQAISDGQQQIAVAFSRLDRQIRYASGVSNQGTVDGDPYVEFITSNTGSPVCTQLRLRTSTSQLQQRTWTQGTGAIRPTPWVQMAGNVSATAPFVVTAAGTTVQFQRLAVSLTATFGGAAAALSRQFTATFTALNTSLSTTSSTVCSEGRGVA